MGTGGKKENVHAGHRQRKKEQFFQHGADAFADHELLELLLFYAIPRVDTNPIAHTLLEHFGSLENLFAAPADKVAAISGMGPSSAVLVSLVAEIYHRAVFSSMEKEKILDTLERQSAYFIALFATEKREIMYQLCLDAKGRFLHLYKINDGGSSGVSFDVRKIVVNALNCNAAAVVLAHNHPSGIALPSDSDRFSTEDVQNALQAVHVTLLDHIIVADNDLVSFRDSHML